MNYKNASQLSVPVLQRLFSWSKRYILIEPCAVLQSLVLIGLFAGANRANSLYIFPHSAGLSIVSCLIYEFLLEWIFHKHMMENCVALTFSLPVNVSSVSSWHQGWGLGTFQGLINQHYMSPFQCLKTALFGGGGRPQNTNQILKVPSCLLNIFMLVRKAVFFSRW